MRFLITGTAGFIGFHLARRLLADGHVVAGIDGMTPYYDVKLKEARHAQLAKSNNFTAHIVRLEDEKRIAEIVSSAKPDIVFHLAAQAGVRYSLENPAAYIESNINGTFNMLEALRRHPVQHLIFASTSSVYGAGTQIPFVETAATDQPLTLYAATKKAGELMAHNYAHLWKQPITATRFFTVYGPWGRPDMALFKFVFSILKDEPIEVYGEGKMTRDFTYVEDLVEGLIRLAHCVPGPSGLGEAIPGDTLSPVAPFRLVNIGRGAPVALPDFIEAIEQAVGKKAKRNLLPMQPGDVPATFANSDLLERLTGYRPSTDIADGVEKFVTWYRGYFA
ncbi:MAG TPA: NAD-dependent epimerase/dehydratase family protein [Xanthobacteraceae bacterium]|nr:NAD-dependent epimerase/dehydratase family protein [Xanthobacteraceae bacterium]